MDIRSLILAALAAPAAACSSVWNCNPDDETFSITEEPVSEADVQSAMEDHGIEERGDELCEPLCTEIYRDGRGWESNVTECSLNLNAEAGETAETVVGSITCSGYGFEYFCEGRRPLGYVETARSGDDAGHFLADCALLEAASASAFRQLAVQLFSWQAPSELIYRCLQAAEDEARHARIVGQLATARGAQLHPRSAASADGSLKESAPGSISEGSISEGSISEDGVTLQCIALHNAVEGCVHEAWAALAARWKAANASDPEVRAAYCEIMEEEAEHAQLAWDLHAWMMGRLSDSARAEIAAAQQHALNRLPEIARAQAALTPAELGLPESTHMIAVAAAFRDGLRPAA